MFLRFLTLLSRKKVGEENLQNETRIRRFLLGELPENERQEFEEKFVADEGLFEQTRVVEDELIESYVIGRLSSDEKAKFERVFLSTEARRQRIAFARTMLGVFAGEKELTAAKKTEAVAAVNQSVWHSVTNFFKTPSLAFGTALAILLLAFGFWFLISKSAKSDVELAQQGTPTPTVQIIQPKSNQNSSAIQNDLVDTNSNIAENNSGNRSANFSENASANKNSESNTNRKVPARNQNSDSPRPSSAGATPVLALFAGTIRADGKMSTLPLPKTARGANLRLNLESQDYKIYQVEVVDPDGNLVFKKKKLKAVNSKINIFVPAAKLQIGDYIVKLSAFNERNENESVADYTFRVIRK